MSMSLTRLSILQNVLARLENQRPELEQKIADGRALLQQGDMPEFLENTVSILEDTVRETQTLAQIKYQSLKESLHNWEEYEGIKTHVTDFLKKAENESAKHPTLSGRETVQKELAAKQVCWYLTGCEESEVCSQ